MDGGLSVEGVMESSRCLRGEVRERMNGRRGRELEGVGGWQNRELTR